MDMTAPPRQDQRFLASTHEVTNVARELVDYNLYREDAALVEAVRREGAAWADDALARFGAFVGRAEYLELGALANKFPPELDTHDRFGNRVDLVRFHPAYHTLMKTSIEHGLHSSPWTDPKPGAHVARAAHFYLHTQVEAGHGCPITMTFASLPSLRIDAGAGEDLGAQGHGARLRPAQRPRRRQAGPDDRHGDDREAGRLGRAREHDAGLSARRRGAGRGVRARRPQVLRLGADVRRLPRAGADERRAVVLPAAALAPRRDEEPAAGAAPQAQDGQRLERVERDRAARRARLDARRAGPRRANDHRDGRDDALRLHGRLVGRPARGRRAGAAPLLAALGVRHPSQPPAADAQRARRPGARERGIARADDARRARARPPCRPARGPARAPRHAGRQVLDLQAHAQPRLRGDGMHRRQRRDGRQPDAAPVPRIAGQRDLGRQRQRPVPRRAARDAQEPAGRRRRSSPSSGARAARTRGSTAGSPRCSATSATRTSAEYRARGVVDRMALALQAALLVQNAPAAVADAFCASRLEGAGQRNFGSLPTGADCAAIIERATPRA